MTAMERLILLVNAVMSCNYFQVNTIGWSVYRRSFPLADFKAQTNLHIHNRATINPDIRMMTSLGTAICWQGPCGPVGTLAI